MSMGKTHSLSFISTNFMFQLSHHNSTEVKPRCRFLRTQLFAVCCIYTLFFSKTC